jgi:hypothetical protein
MEVAFVLPIFPEGSLAESVTTTVWIGVFILAFMNLRFGWTLSGLVTPGYLVPLLIVKPIAAFVIIAEGIMAYICVWFFSQYCSRFGRWSNFFGRDRFFALILASIAIRVALDGYLLPSLARASADTWARHLDLDNNLHSFGLIIVSLIANQFWKPGLARGLPALAVTVGVTYLIVRYPLMHFTNFSIGSLEYMYEDIASSILASPKAYIVLVITAFIASRLNLYYSWDFNGILIPSLLALQWYEPLKILTSFCEAWVIYFLARLVLKLPFLKEATVEGARKILLFFNLSYAYKIVLGHVLFRVDPAYQASDFFGFGYLLPSLIALKMHDKGIPVRLTRTTLQASLVGAAAASIVGFLLTLVPEGLRWSSPAIAEAAHVASVRSERGLVAELQEDKISMYEQRLLDARSWPLQRALDALSAGLRSLRAFLLEKDPAGLARARAQLLDANYELIELEEQIHYLRELEPRRGWGLYILDGQRPGSLLIEVPAPLDEWATLEAGAYLFKLFGASGLAISTRASGPGGGARDVLTSHRSFFQAFHKVFGIREALQVRAGTPRIPETDEAKSGGVPALPEPTSGLWISSRLPSALRLAALKEALAGLSVEWGATPGKNIQRDSTLSGFAELCLNLEDRKRLLARHLLGLDGATQADAVAGLRRVADGVTLQEWVLELKAGMAERGTNLYVKPGMETLLFLDEEVLKPILQLCLRSQKQPLAADEIATEIQAIHGPATSLNYEILLHKDPGEGSQHLVLRERPDAFPRRHWGTYIFRLGSARQCAIEVPHPIYEMNTLECGTALFERLQACCLLIAGSHPKANIDSSSDVILPENKRSLFNLVNQVVLRETRETQLLVVQVRALGPKRGVVLPEADALLSLSDAGADRATLSQLCRDLVSSLDEEQLRWKFVDGSATTAGYEVHGSAQAQYLPHTRNKEFAALWLSPFIRLGYRQHAETTMQEAQFAALGVTTTEDDVATLVNGETYLEAAEVLEDGSLLGILEHYHRTQDINSLFSIRLKWPELRLLRVIDQRSKKPFLLILSGSTCVPVLMNLAWNSGILLRGSKSLEMKTGFPPSIEAVRHFVESGAVFLVPHRGGQVAPR